MILDFPLYPKCWRNFLTVSPLRWTALKMKWIFFSIVLSDINFPTSLMNLYPFGPHTPMVSTQIGTKWNSFVINLYFQFLSSSAFSYTSLLLFREFHCELNNKTITLCEIESAELKGKVRVSLWAYLKVLDLVLARGVP